MPAWCILVFHNIRVFLIVIDAIDILINEQEGSRKQVPNGKHPGDIKLQVDVARISIMFLSVMTKTHQTQDAHHLVRV